MKKIILPGFIFLIFCSTLSSASAPNHWDFAGWYGGGCYPNIEPDPHTENRIYLTSDVAGIWRSDDRGEHWNFATRGLGYLNVPLLAVASSDANVLYAGTSGGIFFSQNAGENWNASDDAGGRLRFSRPESHRSIVISKDDASRVIAGSSTGEVFLSDDFGKKWKLLGDHRPFGKIGAITALEWLEKENVLVASSAQGLAEFSFVDQKWKYFRESPRDISDFWISRNSPRTVYAVGQNKIFISRDGGAHWMPGSVIPNGVLFRLWVPEPGKKTMLAAWNDGWKGGVVRSDDEGKHWKPWDKIMNPDVLSDPTRVWAGAHGRITALKADPFHKNVLYRADWWGVWRSDDGGVTWDEKIKGAPNTVTTDIAVSDRGEVYVATMDAGLLKSADGGQTYQTLFPAKGYAKDVNGHVWRVKLLGEKILATSTAWGLDHDQVILSSDGGASFKKSNQGLPAQRPRVNTVWENGYARAIAVHPKEPDTVYLGIDGNDGGGFFVSKDGGESWQRPQGQPGAFKIYNALAVDPEDPQRILWGASGRGGGVYLSEDGGNHWNLCGTSRTMKSVFDVAFGPQGRAYAGGDDGEPVLYVSEDRGKNWKLLKKFEGAGSVKGLCVLPDGRIATGVVRWHAKAPGHVYLGSADGKSWENIDGDLPEGDGPSALTYDEKQKTLYLARYAGSVYKWRMDG